MAKSYELTCERKPTRFMKVPLKSTEQIYLVFLIPVLLSCIVYMLNFAADSVVAYEHYRDNNITWSICTIVFIYAPAIVYFILTVSRPGWWLTEDQRTLRGVVTWFILQICQMIAFPLFAIWRFSRQIVVIVDAIFLKGNERVKTLNIAAAPAAIELYFFLQAWFQAIPQAILQVHLLFRERLITRSTSSIIVQVLSIFMSIIVIAIQTALFQRFESQRISGRKLPWAMWLKKYRTDEFGNNDEIKPLQSIVQLNQLSEINPNGPDDKIEEHTEAPRLTLERQVSMTPPLPPKNAQMLPPPAPIRGVTSVASLPPPDMIAPPRPDTLIFDDDHDNTTTTTTITPTTTTPINNKITTIETNSQTSEIHWRDIKVPQRKDSVKGMEEDDPVGKLIAFIWWFFFILARIFAIALFYEFHPIWLGGIIGIHYIVMLGYLFYHAKDYNITTIFVNLWLGFVYIFVLVEYRIKFKYADKGLFFYYTFVIIQNVIMTLTWFIFGEYDGFWFKYIFYTILASMVLCITSTTVYHVLFKPGTRRVFASEDNKHQKSLNTGNIYFSE